MAGHGMTGPMGGPGRHGPMGGGERSKNPGKGDIVRKRLMKYYVSLQTKPFPVDMRLKWLS